MSKLFEATEINGMVLSNRCVRSATWEGMATEDGAPTAQLIDLMEKLAGGGVGLIISSHSYIRPDGQAHPWQLGIYKDELIDGLKMMTKAVHAQGGKIVIQITHAGVFANSKLTGQRPLAPSEIDGFAKSPQKKMSVETIQEIIEAFTRAAKRAKESGFDGIQIFAGHGYLLSQFLSPAFNKRKASRFSSPIVQKSRSLPPRPVATWPGTIPGRMCFNSMSTGPLIAASWRGKSQNTRRPNPKRYLKNEFSLATDDDLWPVVACHSGTDSVPSVSIAD